MASERMIATNRANARRSTGPRSAEGRGVVRLNAVRHGLTSRDPVVPGLESADEWAAHRAGLMAALRPDGGMEEALAERVASVLWRLARVTRAEREAISLSQESVERDVANRDVGLERLRGTAYEIPPTSQEDKARLADQFRRERLLPSESQLVVLARYEAHLGRQLSQALHELQRLQAGRGASAIAPPVAVDVMVAGGT